MLVRLCIHGRIVKFSNWVDFGFLPVENRVNWDGAGDMMKGEG